MKLKSYALSRFLKFGILFFGITLLLWNCEKEETVFEEEQQSSYSIQEKTFSELSKEMRFRNTMDQFFLKKSLNKTADYQFEIDSTRIKEINFGESTTYTFGIKREVDSLHLFENLVITVDSLENVNAMLFKYYPDDNVEIVDHHETVSFEGQAELVLLDYDEVLNHQNRTSDLICVLVSTTYCTATGQGNDGVNYTSTHVAGESCSGFEDQQFTITNNVCFSLGNPVPQLIDISYDGGNTPTFTTGGGTIPENPDGLPFFFTSPTYDYSVQNLISILGLSHFSQYDLISFLEDNLDVALQIHLFLGENPSPVEIESATDVVKVLRGVSPPSILDTFEEHRLHASIIGNELNSRGRLFSEINIAFSEIDIDNILSLSDWQLISVKLQEIYDVIPNYDGLTLDDYSQLSLDDQRLIIENSLFSFFLPNVKSLVGDYWPQNADEWAAIGTILGEFLIEIGLALIPGSGIIDAVSSIQNGQYWAAAVALATVVADFFGGTIIKFLGKMGKIIYKTFKIFKLIKKHLDRVINALNNGLKFLLDNQIVRILDDFGNEIARIVDNILTFNYAGFGGDIVTTPNKTTTIVGRWQDNIHGGGTKDIIESGLSKSGENVGGLNALSFDSSGMSIAEQWVENKNWLDATIARGDVIRGISDPTKVDNIIFNNINDINFNSFDDVVNYMNTFDEFSQNFHDLGFYGKEVYTLLKNGYSFNPFTKHFSL